ncbi:MAG: PilZ domain-containing protein [Bdellovibrio sp.]
MKTQGKVWIIYDAEKKAQTKPMSVVQAQVIILTLTNTDHDKFFIWTPGWDDWICIRKFLLSEQTYFVLTQPPKPNEKTKTAVQKDQTLTATHSVINDSPYTQVIVGETPQKAQAAEEYWLKDFNGHELDLQKIEKINPDIVKKKIAPSTKTKAANKEPEGADRRRDTRHNFKIEIVLVSKIRSFRTYSKNISISGTLLEVEIPKDFFNKPFDLIIVNPFEADRTKSRLLFQGKIIGDMTDPRRLMFIEQDPEMTKRLDALLKAYVAYQNLIKKSAG